MSFEERREGARALVRRLGARMDVIASTQDAENEAAPRLETKRSDVEEAGDPERRK
jgi:hypothetical protein